MNTKEKSTTLDFLSLSEDILLKIFSYFATHDYSLVLCICSRISSLFNTYAYIFLKRYQVRCTLSNFRSFKRHITFLHSKQIAFIHILHHSYFASNNLAQFNDHDPWDDDTDDDSDNIDKSNSINYNNLTMSTFDPKKQYKAYLAYHMIPHWKIDFSFDYAMYGINDNDSDSDSNSSSSDGNDTAAKNDNGTRADDDDDDDEDSDKYKKSKQGRVLEYYTSIMNHILYKSKAHEYIKILNVNDCRHLITDHEFNKVFYLLFKNKFDSKYYIDWIDSSTNLKNLRYLEIVGKQYIRYNKKQIEFGYHEKIVKENEFCNCDTKSKAIIINLVNDINIILNQCHLLKVFKFHPQSFHISFDSDLCNSINNNQSKTYQDRHDDNNNNNNNNNNNDDNSNISNNNTNHKQSYNNVKNNNINIQNKDRQNGKYIMSASGFLAKTKQNKKTHNTRNTKMGAVNRQDNEMKDNQESKISQRDENRATSTGGTNGVMNGGRRGSLAPRPSFSVSDSVDADFNVNINVDNDDDDQGWAKKSFFQSEFHYHCYLKLIIPANLKLEFLSIKMCKTIFFPFGFATQNLIIINDCNDSPFNYTFDMMNYNPTFDNTDNMIDKQQDENRKNSRNNSRMVLRKRNYSKMDDSSDNKFFKINVELDISNCDSIVGMELYNIYPQWIKYNNNNNINMNKFNYDITILPLLLVYLEFDKRIYSKYKNNLQKTWQKFIRTQKQLCSINISNISDIDNNNKGIKSENRNSRSIVNPFKVKYFSMFDVFYGQYLDSNVRERYPWKYHETLELNLTQIVLLKPATQFSSNNNNSKNNKFDYWNEILNHSYLFEKLFDNMLVDLQHINWNKERLQNMKQFYQKWFYQYNLQNKYIGWIQNLATKNDKLYCITGDNHYDSDIDSHSDSQCLT